MGGDLNMKKSWHPLLHTNQERVWKQEQKAVEERKKLAELRKEQEQERAVQELQRLQAEAGGGKVEQKVEWMYAAPAEGNGPNAEELEAYLLGKKRVDKLLKGNEEKLMAAPSTSNPGGSFTSIQNANSARDTAAKIREDPLLAIKRQEQAQYEKILKNPRKLKELRAAREAATMTPGARSGRPSEREEKKRKKDETKEERRIRKEGKKEKKDGGHKRSRVDDHDDDRHSSRRPRLSHSRSPSPPRRSHDHRPSYDDRRPISYEDRRPGSPQRYDDRPPPPHQDRSYRPRSRSPPPPPRQRSRSPPPPRTYDRPSHDRPSAASFSNSQPSHRPPPPQPSAADDAARASASAARLAAMQSSALALTSERNARLGKMEQEDREQLEKEERNREIKGDVAPRFLREQEKKVFGGMDLGERLKRSGRVGMVGDRD